MTAFKNNPQGTIEQIQRLLTEGYGSGFTIFKELLQNADDVRATRLLLAGHAGFAQADNALLRAPGFFVANDGPVSTHNWDALQLAAGGGKGGESHAVGRFGLGQKALFHLCDAYAVFARLDGAATPTTMILNPYEEIEVADHAHAWKSLTPNDDALLCQWADQAGMGQGLVLYIPLRTATLRPSADRRICLTPAEWTPRDALKDIVEDAQLHAAIACLRHLEQIEIRCPGEKDWLAKVRPGFSRLAGPGDAAQAAMRAEFGGPFAINGEEAIVYGFQRHAADGEAMALRAREDWPPAWTITGPEKAKAVPHGAALICRHPAPRNDKARLRIWQGVYLPLGDPGKDRGVILGEAELNGGQDIDLVVHGDFFVSSNRSAILTASENKGQDSVKIAWNEALLREATLPCVLDAVAGAVRALPNNTDRYDLVRALGKSGWWLKNARTICGGRALARLLEAKGDAWEIVQAESLRPIPTGEATRRRRLTEAWKGFDGWCAANGFILAQGTTLGDVAPRWSDRELAELIAGMAPMAFADKDAAQTLSAILEDCTRDRGDLGPLAASALADAFRAAMRSKAKMAPMLQIKLLTRHLPADKLIALPKSVVDPDLLAHLAGNAASLCVRADYLEEDRATHTRKMALAEAVDLLAAVEPLTASSGRIFDQALAVIALVLQFGPALEELAKEGRALALQVIPVVRVADGRTVLLAPNSVLHLAREKLLFDKGPVSNLSKLAAAVVEPVIYQLRNNISIALPRSSELPSPNTQKDKVEVVGKVKRFGALPDRIALFDELRNQLPPPLLRRLITGEPGLRDDHTIARITGLNQHLMPLVARLTANISSLVMLEPGISDKLSHEEAGKAQVQDFDLAWLAKQLVQRQAIVEPLGDDEAMALLASGIDKDVLRRLALHQVQGEAGLHRPDALLRGRLDTVPAAMQGLVRLVNPWYDAKAAECQSRLIEDWTPERQVAVALNVAQPHLFCGEIRDALERIAKLDKPLFDDLRQKPWLAVGGAGVAPAAVRDLLSCAITGWNPGMTGTPPVLRSALPAPLLAMLDRHALIDDRTESYRHVLQAMARNCAIGLVVDPVEAQADLACLARAKCDLGEHSWPILASALRAFDSEDALRPVLTGIAFGDPDEDSAIDQLNALAGIAERGGQVGEAARRLWRDGFKTRAETLRKATKFLPADLLVESELGRFARADRLALATTGVSPSDRLRRDCLFDAPVDHARGSARLATDSVPIADKLKELFEPFRPFHEIHSGVLMVLAMMGRDKAFRRMADQFHGNPGFDDICAELDAASNRLHGLCDPLPDHMGRLQLTVVPLSNGQALVLSAAGTPMLASAQRDEALLYDCIKVDNAQHSWQLSMSAVIPRDLDHATALLRDAVGKLVQPIGMRIQHQSNAVLKQFDDYLQSDQATLDELLEDIKDGLAERIKKLTRGDYLKDALTRYDLDRKQGRHGGDDAAARKRAKENLWAAVGKPEAAAELLSAIREKMVRRNYAAERTLFELFQNAVDAAHQLGVKSDVRVEATRDETGAITHLRLIHWGRPINVPGGVKTPKRYERDLDNMLDLDSSEKEGEDRGKHGLGFKTCHMLSNDTRVASGRLRFSIRGGMIPDAWEEGRVLQQRYNRREAAATIIDLPIAPGRESDAGRAWDEFVRVVPFLPVTAPDIGQIIVADGDGDGLPSGKAVITPTANPAIAIVNFGSDESALRLELVSGYMMYLKLKNGMPVPFAAGWSRLWNLAPMDGERLGVAWLVDGKFDMDQGRRGLHGQAEDKDAAMHKLGAPLGQRLVELFEGWDRIALAAGLEGNGRDGFFSKLIDLMIGDTDDHLGSQLHGVGTGAMRSGVRRGLSELFAACAVVPVTSGGPVKADEVKGVYRHTLANPDMRQIAEDLKGTLGLGTPIVEGIWADRLASLGFGQPRSIDLGTLAQDLFWQKNVDADEASAFGVLFNSSNSDGWHPEERTRVDEAIRTARLRAENDEFVAPKRLWFLQDKREAKEGIVERLRAAFMPIDARLHPDYQGYAIEFAQLARARAGYSSTIELSHLETAYLEPTRCLAALIYLAAEQPDRVKLNWLPDVATLRQRSEYKQLDNRQRNRLEQWLSDYTTPLPEEPAAPPPGEPITRSAAEVLHDVAQWWQESREELCARHEQQTYGELDSICSVDALRDGCDIAWFTMLSLGSFQTLGRIMPQQSRAFVQRGVQQGWWQDLATIDNNDRELRPYVDRLLEWSDIGATEDFLTWRRCLGDMCLIARNLGAYRAILLALPQMVAQHGQHVALSHLFRPAGSHIVGRMGIDAAPLARSLGMGANWIVRELARRGVYEADEARLVQPYAWSARLRIRNFVQQIGLGEFDSGVEAGRAIYRAICDEIDDETPFGIDGDLPLELLILSGTWELYNLEGAMDDAWN